MIAIWMLYALALGVLFGLAALALDQVARLGARPRRFIWAGAILASILVPLVGLISPRTAPPRPDTPPPELVPGATAPAASAAARFAAQVTSTTSLARLVPALTALDRPLLMLWCGSSVVLAFGILRAGIALRRRARGWRSMVVDGTPVLVAPDVGPAVVRFGGLRIVLPDWALSAEPAARPLMLLHEGEHCRARDPDLLLGATLTLVLSPWNLALWWQVRRLQLAVETDCDRRVMRAGADAHGYGALLLSVGARQAGQPLLAAIAFAETPSLLERRIEAMTAPRPRHPIARAVLATATAGFIFAAAGMMPRPVAPISTHRERLLSQVPRKPPCTDTLGLRLRVQRDSDALVVAAADLEEVARSAVLLRGYAPLLDSAGAARAPTRVDMTFHLQARYFDARSFVTRAGAAQRFYSTEGSLAPAAGTATVGATLGRAVESALEAVPVGNCLAVGRARIGGQPAGEPGAPAPPGVYAEDAVTERPERLSSGPVRYPDSLRAARVEGRVLIEAIIDTTGHVDPASVRVLSSTNAGFEASAREAVIGSTFRPGRLDGRAVPVIVTIPLNFSVSSLSPRRRLILP